MTGSRDEDRRQTTYLLIAVLAAAGYLWISPLSSSLWLDETVTYWVVKDGLREAVDALFAISSHPRTTRCSGWSWGSVARARSCLRLPSVIAAAGAALLLYRLGTRLVDREAGLLAATAFACVIGIGGVPANARPYATALMVAVAGTLALVRWLDRPSAGTRALMSCWRRLPSMRTTSSESCWPSMSSTSSRGDCRTARRPGDASVSCSRRSVFCFSRSALRFCRSSPAGKLVMGGRAIVGRRTRCGGPSPRPRRARVARVSRSANVRRSGVIAARRGLEYPAPLAVSLVTWLTSLRLFFPRYYLAWTPGLALLAGLVIRTVEGFRRGD